MANTYVTDLRHYLDDSEDLADLPGPALSLAMVLTSVVAWATDHEPESVLPVARVRLALPAIVAANPLVVALISDPARPTDPVSVFATPFVSAPAGLIAPTSALPVASVRDPARVRLPTSPFAVAFVRNSTPNPVAGTSPLESDQVPVMDCDSHRGRVMRVPAVMRV